VYSAATDISTTTALTLLNGISQGDTTITRTGGQIRITSVHIKGTVTADPLNLLSDQYRMMVVWDAQANGAARRYQVQSLNIRCNNNYRFVDCTL